MLVYSHDMIKGLLRQIVAYSKEASETAAGQLKRKHHWTKRSAASAALIDDSHIRIIGGRFTRWN